MATKLQLSDRPPIVEKPFLLDGTLCHLIPLSQGQYAVVDESDYAWLMQWRWVAKWDAKSKRYYASRLSPERKTGGSWYASMHRQILGLSDLRVDPREGDHINHDGLDNRRRNLRIGTRRENGCNRRVGKNNRSGFKGVRFRWNRWVAEIKTNGRKLHLGTFPTAEEAARVYDAAAAQHFGEFANTNLRKER